MVQIGVNIIQVFCKYWEYIVKILLYHCANIMHGGLRLWEQEVKNIVLMCKYCTNIVQIMHNYDSNIVQTSWDWAVPSSELLS